MLDAKDFKQVFAGAAKTSDRYFTLLARDNGLESARLGLVVSKKNIKTAVERNRIKRLIRETFRLAKARLPAKDFVVLVKVPARDTANFALRASLNRFWHHLAAHAHAVAVAD